MKKVEANPIVVGSTIFSAILVLGILFYFNFKTIEERCNTMNNLKRVIVDFKKLTPELLKMLVEKYPDGYGDTDIVHFRNVKGESIEAIEVSTEDTRYLVKIGAKLAYSMTNFDDDMALNIENIDELPNTAFLDSEEE